MYSREERKSRIDVKCPKCGKVRSVKVDTIVHWAKRSDKKFEDYAGSTCLPCRFDRGEFHYVDNMFYDLTTLMEQKSVICGMMLGDGGRQGANTPHSMYIGHSIKQESYALFKKDILNNITRKSVYVTHLSHFIDGKEYLGIRIYPAKSPVIVDVIDRLYCQGYKVVTSDILSSLTLQGIAIWYMDDGSCTRQYRNGWSAGAKITLNTYIPIEQNQLIIDYFKSTWGINWYLNRSKNSWRLGMGKKEAMKFFGLIRPYIIPSMMYKIDLSDARIIA